MKRASSIATLILGISVYLLATSYLLLLVMAFFAIALGMALELTSIKESLMDRILYLFIILITSLIAGLTAESIWNRYTQNPNRWTQKIVFFMIALALAAFWHYRFF